MTSLEEICARRGVKPRGVLHLGAHVGQEAPVYSAWNVARVAWVEANHTLIPELRRNVSGFPGHTVHEAAIWKKDGKKLPFYVASNGGSSSLLRMMVHSRRYPQVTVSAEIKVAAITVDSLIRREGLEAEAYDFLNMDLQGAEAYALRGMTLQLEHLRWIYTEVNFEELYEGCPLFVDLLSALERKGFHLAECRREGEGWGEALFFRP